MATGQISISSFNFLNDLKQNNNREWFTANKEVFQQEQEQITAFADALLYELNTHDVIETPSGKKSLHRIYRDTRFSTNKNPYKTNWNGHFRRATKYRRGGYYFHIEPGRTFVAGGFWGPVPQDLKLIRDDIAFDPAPLRAILNNAEFKSAFGVLRGEQVKTTPKGYSADHEAIDLLRFKQFVLVCAFTDEEVLSPDFARKAGLVYRSMRPFFDYMSEVLTTDVNGLKL
ncbi:DUF2461 domain-containing protein [Mucilaginibacter mali]|uniref:DUF2461 domain-containing protein n=1 Tax=Mucilaginibacter mali TaxID=2740462 RepID=A0A7D4PSE7_9SPHI|nr:DUF2461 domain-containing protein [Mucilaginibacter mali]QKJ29028.1 DUF2461 domain-containing protein [Mucilaginibacter mali]